MKRIAGIVGGEGAMKGRWADRPEWGNGVRGRWPIAECPFRGDVLYG
ncbi:hypothetical protein NB646_05220 [Oxalobacter aliiformigenes]|uniref:Uncharacterized protein n=1 Tax=Oxalobacter aliiformigenes TaxID=2946593 RepID=A0A9E9LG38_9BURK|nr:hypothetical protein [Oxalobacter aliiformigenes]WAV92118.1 hypothetical protein NB646_05220 [Oxalobacter aliiformigenes]WAV92320.1 hypothetical protein NB641_05785 [Oxalobacter aliiformigenes]WAV94272.1 hypothetical protein NB643_05315 [Oxalobacter aliiformigenes]WAV97915.1 hypothetical protein NB645_04095 [Oxalobacter aliiformigenes]